MATRLRPGRKISYETGQLQLKSSVSVWLFMHFSSPFNNFAVTQDSFCLKDNAPPPPPLVTPRPY